METEPTPAGGSRPRSILLVVLGIAVLALVLTRLMPSGSATQSRPTSNQPRAAAVPTSGDRVDPQDLDVHLGRLSAKRPQPSDARRNPFRFGPTEPDPSPAPPPTSAGAGRGSEEFTPPPPPPRDPGPPQIPLKYLGLIEGQGKKLAALSDCKFTYRGEEGEIVDGRYRLVKIGVESVVMEYVDGRGRTTIRLSGQDCIGR